MDEQKLKEKLHSTLIAKSKISDVCEDLQVKCLEQFKQNNQAISRIKELLEINAKLQSVIEREREFYAEHAVILSPEDIKEIDKAVEDSQRIISRFTLGE